MRLGIAAALLGVFLMTLGIFVLGGRSYPVNLYAYVLGIVLTALGVGRLVWFGWRGSGRSWLVAAFPAAILTWPIYELVRQDPFYLPVGFLGTYTAPLLSSTVATALLAIGWFRNPSRVITRRGVSLIGSGQLASSDSSTGVIASSAAKVGGQMRSSRFV